jgi:hypothetical protein
MYGLESFGFRLELITFTAVRREARQKEPSIELNHKTSLDSVSRAAQSTEKTTRFHHFKNSSRVFDIEPSVARG